MLQDRDLGKKPSLLCWKFKAFQKLNDGKWESFKTWFFQKVWGYCWDTGVMVSLCKWGPLCVPIKDQALVRSRRDLKGNSVSRAGRWLERHFGSCSNSTLQPFDLRWSSAHNHGLGTAGQLCCLPSDPSVVKLWFYSSTVDTSPVAALGIRQALTLMFLN